MSANCLTSSTGSEEFPESRRHVVPPATLPAVALALAALLGASSGGAQNLLVNPEFDGTIAPWTACGLAGTTNSGLLWTDRNDLECTDSGSVIAPSFEIDCNIEWKDANQVAIRQCLPLAGTGVVPGSTEVYSSGWMYLDRAAQTSFALFYFASADCTGSYIDASEVLTNAPGEQWLTFELPEAQTVPLGTASIQYRLYAVDPVDAETIYLQLDGAYLGTAPLVFADGFEGSSDSPCRWISSAP